MEGSSDDICRHVADGCLRKFRSPAFRVSSPTGSPLAWGVPGLFELLVNVARIAFACPKVDHRYV